ncbi:hypothetical protein QR98_0057910 [Sarcoptes scabiei]|uniref:Uncharacterized protein n=1 Tax=Sarcoptes scabiei TaxID=52283 RepID=A0A132A8J6_SARSC|nr:hypothetical protein QR98_0057910 [Sarcoptes scabiei]
MRHNDWNVSIGKKNENGGGESNKTKKAKKKAKKRINNLDFFDLVILVARIPEKKTKTKNNK